MAGEIATQFANPQNRAGAIAKYDLTSAASATIRHDSRSAGGLTLPPTLVTEIFARGPGQATQAAPLENGDYAIAVVERIASAPSPDKDPKLTASLDELRK